MRTLLLLFVLLLLPVALQAQTRDSLIINLKDGQTRKIDLDDIRKIVFDVPLEVTTSAEKSHTTAPYPNPTSSSTMITFELEKPQHLKIEIMSELGEAVRVIEANCNRGTSQIEWDALADDGSRVASGSYYYRAIVNGTVRNGKLLIAR